MLAPSPSHVVLPHRSQTKHGGKKRRPNQKTRSGCVTCKKRRVKCDEARPHCMRCIKFGVICDGYLDLTARSSQMRTLSSTKLKVILPREKLAASPNPIPIARIFAGSLNEIDGECFRLYLEETASQIPNVFSSSLWEGLIPQISEVEPFVRHATIAIGALTKQSKADAREKLVGKRTQTQHLQVALQQYDKSLRGMRNAIANGQQDLRKALIACLLVFCFENMLGNQLSAAKHAESGLMLLYQSHKDPRHDVKHDQSLEPDILEALDALDLQVLFFVDNRTQSIHEHIKRAQTRRISTMPTQIHTLKEARKYWTTIMTRNYHFSKSIQRIDIEKIQQQRAETSPWEDTANIQTGELLLSDSDSTPSSLQEEQMRYRMSIDRWTLATTHLFARLATGTNEREKVGAAILQVQAKVNHIMLSGTFFSTETAYDDFYREFKTIVSLSEIILPHILSTYEGAAPRFHFDIGIVPALYLVGSRCRNYDVRSRAIELLFKANIREGIWDALAVAHMARWISTIEMENLEEGAEIPEEKRAFLSAVNIDLYNKRAIVGATQRTRNGPVQTKALLIW